MEFTFGICTYNSSDFILETLESIKYQVNTYGKQIDVKLIVCDDCSDDNTVNIIDNWLNYNKIFIYTKILKNDVNSGIAKSYAKLLLNIDTEFFIKLDGDDVLASVNIFKKCFALDKNECGVFLPLMFNEKKEIYVKNELISSMYYFNCKKHSNKDDIHLIETIKPFITPEVVICRSNFTKDCIDFISKFNQFEDDTSIWYIFKNNKDIKLKFINEPLVLYRVHNKSLSNGITSVNQIHFLDDLHKFKKILFKQEKNLIIKFILFFAVWDTFLMKHRFSADNSIFRKIYLNRLNCIKNKAKKTKNFHDFENKINELCDIERKYLATISFNGITYYQNYNNLSENYKCLEE